MESESNHSIAIVKQVMPMMRIPDRWDEIIKQLKVKVTDANLSGI